MSLHDQLPEDLSVFLDTEDFGEMHDLNDTVCPAVVQEISAEEELTTGGYTQRNAHLGLYGTVLQVHCRERDLPEVPAYGQAFYLDEKLYLVVSCERNAGMLTIKLEANER